jgi:hypothetical protein
MIINVAADKENRRNIGIIAVEINIRQLPKSADGNRFHSSFSRSSWNIRQHPVRDNAPLTVLLFSCRT